MQRSLTPVDLSPQFPLMKTAKTVCFVLAIAVAYRLGVSLMDKEIACPLCTQLINKFADHATCCTKSGDVIIRHNSLRNLVEDFGTGAMLSPA